VKENYSLLTGTKLKRKTSNCQKHSLEALTLNVVDNKKGSGMFP